MPNRAAEPVTYYSSLLIYVDIFKRRLKLTRAAKLSCSRLVYGRCFFHNLVILEFDSRAIDQFRKADILYATETTATRIPSTQLIVCSIKTDLAVAFA